MNMVEIQTMTPIRPWLKKQVAGSVLKESGLGLFLLILAACVLAITFFLTYAVIWFGYNVGVAALAQLLFNKPLHLSATAITVICFIFLALLFVEQFRVDSEYWQSYSLENNVPEGLVWIASGLGALAGLLFNAAASAKVISDLLLSGPKLVFAGISSLKKAVRCSRLNIDACSAALEYLLANARRVPLPELADSLSGQNPDALSLDLPDIDGVVMIENDPVAFSLTDDLRLELGAVIANGR